MCLLLEVEEGPGLAAATVMTQGSKATGLCCCPGQTGLLVVAVAINNLQYSSDLQNSVMTFETDERYWLWYCRSGTRPRGTGSEPRRCELP